MQSTKSPCGITVDCLYKTTIQSLPKSLQTMQTTKSPCGITLDCLYKRIQSLQKDAQLVAHKKFLAARMIQKIYRGYRVRKSMQICRRNAIVIQKYYRAHKARNEFYLLLEVRLQTQLEERYNYYATIIQKWFRGYYSRKYIHDYAKLREKQRQAAKELILCVAHKLHHLLRTRQIPGIYSLRNSHCLSKVEELLASLKFRDYNEQVRTQRCAHKQKMAAVAPSRKDGKTKLNIPFGPRCQDVYKKYSMQKLHHTLEQLNEKEPKPKYIPPRKVQESRIVNPEDGVYARVVSSMQRFKIINPENMSVCNSVIHHPEKIEQFCNEMTRICSNSNLCL